MLSTLYGFAVDCVQDCASERLILGTSGGIVERILCGTRGGGGGFTGEPTGFGELLNNSGVLRTRVGIDGVYFVSFGFN